MPRLRSTVAGWLLAPALAVSTGCGHGSEPAAGDLAFPSVELSGCAAIRTGPACEVPLDRRLRLWVGGTQPASVRITVDGRLLTPDAASIQGGALLHVDIPAGAVMLAVTV